MEPGTALHVRHCRLRVREPAKTFEYPARVHALKTVMLVCEGGSVTLDALQWLSRERVAL